MQIFSLPQAGATHSMYDEHRRWQWYDNSKGSVEHTLWSTFGSLPHGGTRYGTMAS